MPITVIVRPTSGNETRLTFDGTQRIVFGRGAGCDVRLPDPSVSLRHASLRGEGADFLLYDEGSTNGTFVGDVRIAPRTSRIVRSGTLARLGRVWIELRIEHTSVTRDVAIATRDLALAMVGNALDAVGEDPSPRVLVVEGRDQGVEFRLAEEGRIHTLGRGHECALPLADPDASREHAAVARRGSVVFVRDLGAKNGTWLGEARLPPERDVPWRTTQMMRIGKTVLALREPVGEALARIEQAPDEAMLPGEDLAPKASQASQPGEALQPTSAAPVASVAAPAATRSTRQRAGWSGVDRLVMAAALAVLVLSIAGLVWLLRG